MTSARMTGLVPVLGIGSYDEAVAHYVGWLGFNLDWEWREAPGKPVIMSISRDSVSIMLNEHDDSMPGGWLTVKVDQIGELEAEWNDRRPGSVAVIVGEPYDIPSMLITDPFGNRIDFQQPISETEEKARLERADEMRAFIINRLDAGQALPAPVELVEAIGRPIGLAMDVLCEFEADGDPR